LISSLGRLYRNDQQQHETSSCHHVTCESALCHVGLVGRHRPRRSHRLAASRRRLIPTRLGSSAERGGVDVSCQPSRCVGSLFVLCVEGATEWIRPNNAILWNVDVGFLCSSSRCAASVVSRFQQSPLAVAYEIRRRTVLIQYFG